MYRSSFWGSSQLSISKPELYDWTLRRVAQYIPWDMNCSLDFDSTRDYGGAIIGLIEGETRSLDCGPYTDDIP